MSHDSFVPVSADSRAAGVAARLAALLLLVTFPATAAAQQSGAVTGTVTDASSGEPLADAQVFVPGSGLGTLTDQQGQYRLTDVTPGERTLRVRLLGYEGTERTMQVTAGQAVTADFSLTRAAIEMEELVVTGSGIQTERRKIGSDIASVNTEEIEDAPVNDMSDLLQARTPGMSIVGGGGKVGQQSKVILRGVGTVSQGTSPVIYVDGIRLNNDDNIGVWTGGTSWSGLDDINPADIERIEVVKGAAAATMYGTEASAGVIQIFTKQGTQSGNQLFRYRGEFGASQSPLEYWNISLYSPWFHENFVSNGYSQSHQLTTQGGSESFSHFVSGTFRDQSGNLPENDELYYSGRANMEIFPLDGLSVRFNAGYTHREIGMPQDANNIYGYGINALVGGAEGAFMPISDIELIDVDLTRGRFVGGATARYRHAGGFSHSFTFGADITNTDNTDLHPYGANQFNPQGRRENWRRNSVNLNIDYTGTWETDVTDAVSSSFSAGFQANRTVEGTSDAYGEDFPAPGLSTVGGAANTSASEWRQTTETAGFFAQEQVGLADRLYLTGGLRLDGHSSFGDQKSYQLYPKASLSWVLSEHDFTPDVFSTLRLRGAYGEAGRQPGAFDAVRTWEPTDALDGEPALSPANLGNPQLGPEVSQELEAGLDLGLLSGRVSSEVTLYRQTTEGALIPVRPPPSQGFLETQLRNVGKIRSQGLEASVDVRVLDGDRFTWNLGVNGSLTDNEIRDLGGEPELYVHWTQANRVGYPVGSFFGDRYVERDGEAVFVEDEPFLTNEDGSRRLDANGNPIRNPDNPGYIGPPFPTRTFQMTTRFSLWERLNVRALMDHAGGHYTESSTIRWLTRSTVPADDDVVAEQHWGESVARYCHENQDVVVQAMCDDPWPQGPRGNVVMPADYWKLREVTLSYRMPSGLLGDLGVGLRSARVFLTGRNLWRSQETLSMEAEANYSQRDLSMQDYFITPIPRQVTVGVDVGF